MSRAKSDVQGSARTISAFGDDVLQCHDGVALAELIRKGDLTVSEVVDAAIDRAARVDPVINAIVVRDFDRAREYSDRRLSGGFAGVPTFIKDMTDVAGLPTRFGTEALDQSPPAVKTHRIAQQLFDMGMVSIGKSTMPEFGLTPSTEFPHGPPTRNPWNLDHSAGGSSGGAAALVAAGVVPIANAADGGGSIRIPAAACGLVGMKATRGRLPASQAHEPFVGLVTDGVVTRTVRDTALFLAEAERLDPNPKLTPIGHVVQPLDRPLRIGAVADPPTDVKLDEVVQREFDTTLKRLESLGHHVEPITLSISPQFAEDFLTVWSMLAMLSAKTSKYMINAAFDTSRLTEITRGLGQRFYRCMHHAPGAILRLRRSHIAYSAQFKTWDVIVCPTVGQRTPPLGHLAMDLPFDVIFPRMIEWVCFTPYANATGGPSLNLPLGFDEPTNLPIGMLFHADLGQERLLLELALQLEQEVGFRSLAVGR